MKLHVVIQRIDGLRTKGGANVSQVELEEIRHLALADQHYEHQKYAISLAENN